MTCPSSHNWYDQEGDEIVGVFFSPDDLRMSPEEYAARNAHLFACFGLYRLRFRDPVLGAWVRRFAEILFSPDGELERCRRQFLTAEEIAEVHRQEAEPF
jgi:hypothetical protein